MARNSNAGKKRVTFEVSAPVGSEVFLAGTFNDWDTSKKPMLDKGTSGLFRGVVMLPKGRHEYKFLINGDWSMDASNPNFVMSDVGSLNSVIEVQ